ncbi:hypothetical protein K438DRAFT_1960995 [Mycena galopus ATCC 62051]|nr:hypothetical protein K438DRAFT_1960995 [Mycena galopus ATCC 62051]
MLSLDRSTTIKESSTASDNKPNFRGPIEMLPNLCRDVVLYIPVWRPVCPSVQQEATPSEATPDHLARIAAWVNGESDVDFDLAQYMREVRAANGGGIEFHASHAFRYYVNVDDVDDDGEMPELDPVDW